MDLMQLLPWHIYHGEEHVADLQQAIGGELAVLVVARDELYRQFRPSTAEWGLAMFEKEYGLAPEAGRSLEQRLARWRAWRRGRGTTTTAVLEEIASGLTARPCVVTEYPEEDRFELVVGWEEPNLPTLADLMEIIEELKPAHLGAAFRLRVNTRGGVYAAGTCHYRVHHTIPLNSEPVEAAVVHLAASVHLHIHCTIPYSDQD